MCNDRVHLGKGRDTAIILIWIDLHNLINFQFEF